MNHSRHQILIGLLSLVLLFPFLGLAQVNIITQPQSQNVPTGAPLVLSVQATGTGPLSYQWRLNGVNIPGANSSIFTIANFQPANSGDYTVAVGDATGTVNSEVAKVRAANLSDLPFTDAMNGQNRITESSRTGRGSNVGATKEPGEPNHANKPGTNSVWLTWQAPLLGGVATFDTAGTSFDSLLAVYTGDHVTNLTLVASNDDTYSCDEPTRGFHTSRVRFNAMAGAIYHIAVDGLTGATGDIVLSWDLNLLENLLPVLSVLPTTKVGLPGDNSVSISVAVQGGTLVTYQWYLNCQLIPGATQNVLPLVDLQAAKVGDYTVRVKDVLTGQETISDPVNIQINSTDGRLVDVSALDKFPETSDSVRRNPLNPSRLQKATRRSSAISKLSGGPVRGYRGTQIFSTVGATKDPGEPNHCGEAGGASAWYAYQPPASGSLAINTEGSDFDTVLAVYTGPGTDFESLVSVACDNDSGSNGKTSKVLFRVTKDTVYYIAVDGVGGAAGTVVLNYALNRPPIISSIADQTAYEDTPVAAVPFRVDDAETAVTNLMVSGRSSNLELVPNYNIAFDGDGTNRTVVVTPLTNQSGTTTITVTVTDADGDTASASFLLTVNAVNHPPTISSVPDQATDEDTPTPAIPFTISDAETTASNLTVTGSSSNQGLVPNANIAFGGSGSDRTVTIRPATNQFGTTTITLTVTDGDGAAASASFLLTVKAVNDPPTISSIADQSTDEDTPTPAIPFTISDVETNADRLMVAGSSSNQGLVPDANIAFGGSGSDRTVTIRPVTSQFGTTTITITVSDGDGGAASSSFLLTVNAVNHSLTISNVPDQTTDEDTPTPAIPFTISDVETNADRLMVTGSSSNQGLVPDANIAFGGRGSDRTVTIMPATNQFGTARITITVTVPGGASATNAFVLAVNPVNDLPMISHFADQVTAENTPTAAVPFTVGDVETPAERLTLTGGSSNTELVPNSNIVFGGVGADRTVTVTPAGSQSGTAVITVTVTDTEGGAASETFALTVNSAQPLRFVPSSMLNNGAFRLRLTGSPLQNTVIQVSSISLVGCRYSQTAIRQTWSSG